MIAPAARFLLATAAAMLLGCRPHPSGPAPPAPPSPVRFTERAEAAGIRFRHWDGGWGKRLFIEPLGGGCAWLDYDGDGWEDILLLNGAALKGCPPGKQPLDPYPALFRNQQDGTFRDVTAEAGLHLRQYAIGAAVADYDNDGDPDLFIAGYGPDRLLRNDSGRFRDVTAAAGLADPALGTSACWLDYDRDGLPDLYVCNYVRWTETLDRPCERDGTPIYCLPESYPAAANHLYRNLGGGRFRDVTVAMRADGAEGKSLGVVPLDFDGDGWTDLFVANDSTPSFLFRNEEGRRFREYGLGAGVSYPRSGHPTAAMGVDIADFDRTGLPGLAIGNFMDEGMTLFRNRGDLQFEDVTETAALAVPTLRSLTFGLLFGDFNQDARPDLFLANGHILDNIAEVHPGATYAQRPALMLRGEGGRHFDGGGQAGLTEPVVGRGAAMADYDLDGDLDVMMTVLNGTPRLFRNDTPGGSWLGVRVKGGRSGRDGLGARIEVETVDGVQVDWVRSGGSYASESARARLFGLRGAPRVRRLTVRFPGGRSVELRDVQPNRYVLIEER